METSKLEITNVISAEEANKETFHYLNMEKETNEYKLSTKILNLIFLFIDGEIHNGSHMLDFNLNSETDDTFRRYSIKNNEKCLPLILKYLEEQGYEVSVMNTGYEEESTYLHITWGE